MSIENVNVSVSDDHLGRFSDVVAAAKRAGLKVDRQLSSLAW